MSSIFGGSVDDTGLGVNTQFLTNVTSVTEAIQILDAQLTIYNESNLPGGETEPLSNVINNLNTAITDVGDGLSNNLTAENVKTLYESNPDTNAFTDAYKTIVDNIGTYIDETELATALSEYRLAIDQDTIDSGKYSTSNPAGYQTSSQVVNSISDALTVYRTSADEDVINATKLNTADLKSDIVIHPSSGGGPTTYEGTICCGTFENGMHNINGTLIPQFPGLDIYDFSCNGVVNFKGSNYYSFNFGQNAGSIAFVKETAGVYVNVDKADIFGANPGTFVYKFATNGSILCAIAKQSSTKFFYTIDGITWNSYDIGFGDPMRALDIIDNVIYVANNGYIFKITDVNNPSFESKSTSNNTSKFFKYFGDVYYLSVNGMFDYTTQTLVPGLPSLATQGDVVMSNVIVVGSNLYLVTGLDNDIWKYDTSWSVIATTNFEAATYAIHQYNGIIYLGGYTTDESRYGTLIADTFASVPTNNDSNRQDSGNWTVYGFGDIYSGGGGSVGISVTLDAGSNTTTNVYDTLTDLATANQELRSASFVTITDVNDAISTSQSTQDSAIASIYKTISSFDADIAGYLTTSSASSTYRTIADSYSNSEINSTLLGYVTNTNLTSNYSTTSQINSLISNSQNTQDNAISLTYQTIGGMGAYYTAGQTNSAISSALTPYSTTTQMNTAITNANSTQDSSIASTYKTITSFNTDIAQYIKYETYNVMTLFGSPPPGSTSYPFGNTCTSTIRSFRWPRAGKIVCMWAECRANTMGSDAVFTLRKNGVDTANTFTITSGGSNLSGTSNVEVAFALNDLWNISILRGAGGSLSDVVLNVLINYT